jgi:hypothetical protein
VWRALHDLLDDLGFAHVYDELKLEGSPIEGTATFNDYLIGYREGKETAPLSFLRVLFGILLCLTILLSPLGVKLIRSRIKDVRTWATVSMEGEVYRIRGANVGSARAAEVLDVVADARIRLDIDGMGPEIEDPEQLPVASPRTPSGMFQEFQELESGLSALLPAASAPAQTPSSTDLIP